MRVAMIARALPRPDYAGGVSGQVHLLATALARRGHDVTVYALNEAPDGAPYEYRRIPLPQAVARHARVALYLFPWWMSRLPLEAYDIIHAHGDDHFLRTRRPVVRTFYGSSRAEAENSTKLRHRLYHLSMAVPEHISERRATELVAISATTQRCLRRPSLVIPCGYDPTMFFPAGVKSTCPSILFVGDLGTRKRAELLLKAFATVVRPAFPTAELWMVTTARASGPGIRWFGRVSTPVLADLYRQAWVFCLPSRYEGFGVPYIEAMACGTPVVATPNGGAEEVLEGGRWGRLVREQELGQALVELLTSKDTRQTMTERGLERVKGFDIALIAEQYEAAYTQAVAAGPREALQRR
jgi:glycosyltransferase involved in cell wall biosynthesis